MKSNLCYTDQSSPRRWSAHSETRGLSWDVEAKHTRKNWGGKGENKSIIWKCPTSKLPFPCHSSYTKLRPWSFFPSEDINSRDQHFWCSSFHLKEYRDLISTVGCKQPEATSFPRHQICPSCSLVLRLLPGHCWCSSAWAADPSSLFPTCCLLPPHLNHLSFTHTYSFPKIIPRQSLASHSSQIPELPLFCVEACLAVYCSILNGGQFSAGHNADSSIPSCWHSAFRPFPCPLIKHRLW